MHRKPLRQAMFPFAMSHSLPAAARRQEALRTYTDAVAIVTGGASGIGEALSCELAKRGAHVVIADIRRERGNSVAKQIRAHGGKATAVKIDINDAIAVRKLIEGTFRTHGRLDYLFNNAGIGVLGLLQHTHQKDWDRLIDINLKGTLNGVNAAYPLMVKQGFGHIVNTSSVSGLLPSPGMVGYATTKHAIVGLSRSLRLEAKDAGVRISVLCPGAVDTPMLTTGKGGGDLRGGLSSAEQQRLRKRLHPMTADAFAKQALKQIARNKELIILPGYWKLLVCLHSIFPWLVNKMAKDLLLAPFKQHK